MCARVPGGDAAGSCMTTGGGGRRDSRTGRSGFPTGPSARHRDPTGSRLRLSRSRGRPRGGVRPGSGAVVPGELSGRPGPRPALAPPSFRRRGPALCDGWSPPGALGPGRTGTARRPAGAGGASTGPGSAPRTQRGPPVLSAPAPRDGSFGASRPIVASGVPSASGSGSGRPSRSRGGRLSGAARPARRRVGAHWPGEGHWRGAGRRPGGGRRRGAARRPGAGRPPRRTTPSVGPTTATTQDRPSGPGRRGRRQGPGCPAGTGPAAGGGRGPRVAWALTREGVRAASPAPVRGTTLPASGTTLPDVNRKPAGTTPPDCTENLGGTTLPGSP